MKNKALQWFFWLTFGAFLAPSIPHIAAIFRAWEPLEAAQSPADLFWWVVSYAVAVSIDGTIIWLTHVVVLALQEKRVDRWYVGSVVLFITFLTSVSWLLNWWYAENDLTTAARVLPGAMHTQIFGIIDSSVVMPIVTSMFPLLAIMFTVMANRVMGTHERRETYEKALTDEEFEAELKRIQQHKAIKQASKGPGLAIQGAQAFKEAAEAWKATRQEGDKEVAQLEKIVAFFRDTPELLSDDNATQSEKAIMSLLKVKRDMATIWRQKAVVALAQRRDTDNATLSSDGDAIATQQCNATILEERSDTEQIAVARQDKSDKIHLLRTATSEGDTRQRILAYLATHANARSSDIVAATGIGARTVQRHLKEIRKSQEVAV